MNGGDASKYEMNKKKIHKIKNTRSYTPSHTHHIHTHQATRPAAADILWGAIKRRTDSQLY